MLFVGTTTVVTIGSPQRGGSGAGSGSGGNMVQQIVTQSGASPTLKTQLTQPPLS